MPPLVRRSSLPALLASVAVLAGSLAVVPGPRGTSRAYADEVAPRPADGVFALDGHGWGHGRGMSQYGAQGAASLGLSADTITGTYYPGTARAVLPDTAVRVLLSGDEGFDTQVVASVGLSVADEARGTRVALPMGYSTWRSRADGAGLVVEGFNGTGWVPFPVAGSLGSPGPYTFSGPAFVRLRFPDGSQRDYRGAVRSLRSGSGVQSLAVMGMEDYLLGVVPREAVSSWLPAALQAQAIAARSYSAYLRAHVAAGASSDICDTTACQVFGGSRLFSPSGAVTELEPATTTAAVRATAGVVRTYAGAPIFAEFSSSNGGWSTAGSFPYLTARQDDWDGASANSVHSWSATVTAAGLEARFPAVGHLDRIRVTRRDGGGDWGGRVLAAALEGTAPDGRATSVAVTGSDVYGAATWPAHADGLRSNWWHVRSAPSTQTVHVVGAMYQDFLGRAADPGGLAFWSGRIAEGSLSTRDVAFSLARSPEYTARVVARLYGEVLGRAPEAGGLAGWARLLQNDPAQVGTIAAGIYASDEFYAAAGGTDAGFVTALYRHVLLRDPEPAGLAGWTVETGQRGRFAVARSIYDAQEDLLARIQLLYAALLGRPADPVGLAGWPAVLLGEGDIALASALASSPEYSARAQTR